ncbi:hypothetical protein HOO68_03880 [Candidatus Gracilibacteria bacterium]|nr:hypothetical protein [Candidatus Gracilibacteria bacterium]
MISREYGKITGWWNKKNITGIDLGDVIEVLLVRDDNKNTIKNIDLITSGWNRNWNYLQIASFLKTLHIIGQISVDNQETIQLYDDAYFLIRYGLKNLLDHCHYTIFQMRILKSLGSMNPEMLGDDPILKYIYNNISNSPLERILSANIKNNHISIIEQINLNSIYSLRQ